MKFKIKRIYPIFLTGIIALTGCGSSNTSDSTQEEVAISQGAYSIDFDSENYTVKSTTVNGETIYYRAYEGIVYVSNPVDIEYQTLNFYVPEAYFDGESINGYNIDTAPILFSNAVGGYMPATASSVDSFSEAGFSIGGHSLEELEMGDDSQISGSISNNIQSVSYSTSNSEIITLSGDVPSGDVPPGDAPSGDAPSGDVPSGDVPPGDAPSGDVPSGDVPSDEHSGHNHSEHNPESTLETTSEELPNSQPNNLGDNNGEDSENTFSLALSRGYVIASIGVRGRTNQDDEGNYTGKAPAAIVDLKAAVRYLRYNDELMAGDANKIISNGTSAGGALSLLLGATGNSEDYETYLDELGAAPASDDIFAVNAFCPITNLENADMAYEWQFNEVLEYGGRQSGTLTDTQIQYSNQLKQSFITYLNSLGLVDSYGNELTLDENGEGTFKNYIASYVIQSAQVALDSGEDLSSYTWLEISDGKVVGINIDEYFIFMGRSKVPTAFDSVDLSSGENGLFGTESTNAQHFTDFGLENSTEAGTLADSQIIKLMNPLNYIGDTNSTNSTYWRIRHGSIDTDTSLAIPTIVANILEQNGYSVDLAFQWNTGHTGDYDLEGFFDWIDSIAR